MSTAELILAVQEQAKKRTSIVDFHEPFVRLQFSPGAVPSCEPWSASVHAHPADPPGVVHTEFVLFAGTNMATPEGALESLLRVVLDEVARGDEEDRQLRVKER